MNKHSNMVLLLPILFIIINVVPSGHCALAPALYVFGDSLFDSGNNNLLPTLAKANFAPYGMNFAKGATGRFTNGKTLVDFFAEYLGLPYAPPYLNIRTLLRPQVMTGINFASGACGILPESGTDLGKCLHLGEQIGHFEKMVKKHLPKKFKSSAELSDYLSKSIFVVSIGSNDYINNYLDTKHYDSSKLYSPQAFAKLLIHQLSIQFQRLYQLGARKVVMFEIGPIGCIPSSVRKHKPVDGGCVEEIINTTRLFNDYLPPMLMHLTSKLDGSNFILGQVYWLGYDAIMNPSKYGLSDSTNPCCLTWFNGTSACIPELGALACENPLKHYFWDGYHLTETVYRAIASRCFNGTDVCFPNNLQNLVTQV